MAGFMSKKIIERRWKEGLIGLLWVILNNNRVFYVEKFFVNKLLPLEFLFTMGYGWRIVFYFCQRNIPTINQYLIYQNYKKFWGNSGIASPAER